MVMVKICGITREEDLEAAVDAGADSLGFVVGVHSSPRNLSLPMARRLIAKVPRNVDNVAVTVFENIGRLKQTYSELKPDYLQLHGDLRQILELQYEIERDRVIVAVDGRATNALDVATEFSGIFQFVLLDTAGDGGLGGTGMVHDWHSSRRIRNKIHPVHLILAGGLTPRNVGEAIRVVEPYGVDVSTGVEKKPGIKDHKKMREFVAKAREAKL
ncbi:phosphoribosylanthranilate isomerase [Candidatus Bathyarchaeota archaeon]|nr:phosphoribosylanthranilate isomerase [Candidatus Bathyarchaeota archaeon]